jgi:hypothetical protein
MGIGCFGVITTFETPAFQPGELCANPALEMKIKRELKYIVVTLILNIAIGD